MKHISMRIAILVSLALSGCGDTQENPMAEDPIAEFYNEAKTETTPSEPEVVFDALYFQRIMEDRPEMPEILVKGIRIDPNEAGKPLPKVVIDVDADNLFGKTPMGLDQQLGQPVDILEAKAHQDPRSHIRYYSIFDNGAAEVSFYDEILMNITLYFRRGYPNSLDAIKAAGFREHEIKLLRSNPAEQIGIGTWRVAMDVYSAETNNRQYHKIYVSQTTKSKVWYTVTIMPKIQIVFDANDNIIEVRWGRVM